MIKDFRIWCVRKLIELNEKNIFDKRLYEFYQSRFVNKPVFVIDVGANIGQSIEVFLKLNPMCDIVSFEPNPKLCKRLKEKYGDRLNVRVFDFGISNVIGQKIFYENVFHATSSFEELDLSSKYLKIKSKVLGVKPDKIIKKSYPVNVLTLSEFIKNQCVPSIDILKIDTEGHEYACLQGLFSDELKVEIKFIQIELHNDDMYLNNNVEEVHRLMHKNGYEIEARIKHGFGDFEDVVFSKHNAAQS